MGATPTSTGRPGRLAETGRGRCRQRSSSSPFPWPWCALSVPISYDFYGQLPSGHPATEGLADARPAVRPGLRGPIGTPWSRSRRPLVVSNVSNATEFVDLEELASRASNTTRDHGRCSSPVGPYGANLTQWLGLAERSTRGPREPAGASRVVRRDRREDGTPHVPDERHRPLRGGRRRRSNRSLVRSARTRRVTPRSNRLAFGGGAPVIRDLADETNVRDRGDDRRRDDRARLRAARGPPLLDHRVDGRRRRSASRSAGPGPHRPPVPGSPRFPALLLRPDHPGRPGPRAGDRLQHLPPHARARGEGPRTRGGSGGGRGARPDRRHHHSGGRDPRLRVRGAPRGRVHAHPRDRFRGRDRGDCWTPWS